MRKCFALIAEVCLDLHLEQPRGMAAGEGARWTSSIRVRFWLRTSPLEARRVEVRVAPIIKAQHPEAPRHEGVGQGHGFSWQECQDQNMA
jgi:hypothetical protein